MGWHGRLNLHYRRDGERTVAHDRHDGPLRVLQALYPEGPGICHHVLVHPPGGIVGGDRLDIELRLDAHSHALVTTPGATRFYRSAGEEARQSLAAHVAAGARLEWLPMETIAYDRTRAVNHLTFTLDAGAEMLGWDLLALGLPAAGEPFAQGRFEQQLSLPGRWLERGVLDFDDPKHAPHTRRLLDSPLGWAGHGVLATLWWASGDAMGATRIDTLLQAARDALQGIELHAGVTSPNPHVVVLRALAHRTEAPFAALQRVRAAWRQAMWGLAAEPPRVWRT
jgi:urease accessory protein